MERRGRCLAGGDPGLRARQLTDFREDLERINVSTPVVHRHADRILPLTATGRRTPEFVKDGRLVVVAGGPHGLNGTHAEEVNLAPLACLSKGP